MIAMVLLIWLSILPVVISAASTTTAHQQADRTTLPFAVCRSKCGDDFAKCSTSARGFTETIYCFIQHKNCSDDCYDQRLFRIRMKLKKCRGKRT